MKTYKKTTEQPLLKIMYDSDPESPRNDTNLVYIITWGSRYSSPDKNETMEYIVKKTGDYANSQEDHIKRIKEEIESQTDEKVLAIYPICKYEHGGISYSLGSNFGFDYSNNGFYIVTDKTNEEIGATEDRFEDIIKGEIETYNKYANGEVYGFKLYDEDGNEIDSCWGFYDIEHIKEHLPEEWENEDLKEYLVG